MSRVSSVGALALCLVLGACGGGGGGEADGPVVPPPTATNTAPVAVAVVAATNVTLGAGVTLDASTSTDADADVLTYVWTLSSKPAGSTAALDSGSSAKPSFVADVSGTYVVSLVVSDGKAQSAAVSVSVTATASNAAPVANAGAGQSVVTGALVRLDGSASADANTGDTLTYAWTLSTLPAGSTATLADASSVAPSFTADRAGSYTATLVVNDGHVDSAAATVSIVASSANAAPVANAGTAQSVRARTVVTLSGAASSDANGDPLTYTWTLTAKPSGSTAVLTGASSVAPTFTPDLAGSYVATLVVNDGQVNSATSSVTIVASAANAAPVAYAGVAQSVQAATLVTLNGAGSTDANGDALTYLWTLSAKPAGSSAVLTGATSASPTFPADIAGTYVATLVVNDGLVSSAASTVSVIATDVTSNATPVASAGTAQSVVAGATVVLNGTASSDEDADPLTYAWALTAKPVGSSAILSGANTAAPTFTADMAGSYVATLVVNDGKASSAAATVSITASVGNAAPIANAGTTQNVVTGSTVTLSGAASSDANGDTLSYAWTLTGRPTGSVATLSGATSVAPSFVADLDGAYVLSLVVHDGKVASGVATVTVRATAALAGLPTEQLMTTSSFGDVEFDWGRDGVYCASCNFGAGNARFNWVDHNYRLWVGGIDPVTGAITPANGRGVLVDDRAVYYTEYGNGPEWVFSALGSQLVYTRYEPGWVPSDVKGEDDTHVGIGFAQMVGGSWTSGFLDGVLELNSPAPTQTVTDAVPSMAFASSTSLRFFWRKLGAPPGPAINTGITTIGLSVRWVPGTGQFVFANGADKAPGDEVGYQQIYFYDTETGADPVQLTFDPTQKRGAFMFSAPEYGGDMVFVTVANRTELRVYRNLPGNDGVRRWTVVKTVVSPIAAEPYIATPEPFTYNGKTWLFMTLSRDNSASDVSVPTSLALTGIDPAVDNMRALTDERSPQRLRQDPEYFITSQGAYIYYSRAIPKSGADKVIAEGYYRVDTGLGPPVVAQATSGVRKAPRRGAVR